MIPVIHYADDAQALRNAERAFAAGCDGVMIIHMKGKDFLIPPIARAIKDHFPDKLVGINLLHTEPEQAVAISRLNGFDMTWTDEQLTHSDNHGSFEARSVRREAARAPANLIFVGVAFKYQRHERDPIAAARRALDLGFIPTTSGPATGIAADPSQINAIRAAIAADAPLAIASGITPENASLFSAAATHLLVATGVSASFHELDPGRLRELRSATTKDHTHE